MGNDTEPLARWQMTISRTINLLERYTKKVVAGETTDGLQDCFDKAKYEMLDRECEIRRSLRKQFRGTPYTGLQKMEYSAEDDPDKPHRRMPRIDGQQHSVRIFIFHIQ